MLTSLTKIIFGQLTGGDSAKHACVRLELQTLLSLSLSLSLQFMCVVYVFAWSAVSVRSSSFVWALCRREAGPEHGGVAGGGALGILKRKDEKIESELENAKYRDREKEGRQKLLATQYRAYKLRGVGKVGLHFPQEAYNKSGKLGNWREIPNLQGDCSILPIFPTHTLLKPANARRR